MSGLLRDLSPLLIPLAMLGVIFLLLSWLFWYRAGMQAKLYKRQGIEISQWEVFMGVEPAERVIQIKETESK